LLAERAELRSPLPANKRFFLIVYKMLVLGRGARKRSFAPSAPRPRTNIDQHVRNVREKAELRSFLPYHSSVDQVGSTPSKEPRMYNVGTRLGKGAKLRLPQPSTTLYTRVLALGGWGEAKLRFPPPAESKVFVYKLVGGRKRRSRASFPTNLNTNTFFLSFCSWAKPEQKV
jgi:hypothetical protein